MKKILLAAVAASAITGSALADEPTTTTFELGGFLLAWLGPDGNPFDGIAIDGPIEAVIGEDASTVSSSSLR